MKKGLYLFIIYYFYQIYIFSSNVWNQPNETDGRRRAKGVDDQLNTDQQSIDSMPKDKTDMLSNIIKGKLLFYKNYTLFSRIRRL